MINLMLTSLLALVLMVILLLYGAALYPNPKDFLPFAMNVAMLFAGVEAVLFAIKAYQLAKPGYDKAISDLDELRRQGERKNILIEASIDAFSVIYSGSPFMIISLRGPLNEEIELEEARVEIHITRFHYNMDESYIGYVDIGTSSKTEILELKHPMIVGPTEHHPGQIYLAVVRAPQTFGDSQPPRYSEEIEVTVYAKVSNGVRHDIVSRRGIVKCYDDGRLDLSERQGTLYQGVYAVDESLNGYMERSNSPSNSEPIVAINTHRYIRLGEPVVDLYLENLSFDPVTVISCQISETWPDGSCRTHKLRHEHILLPHQGPTLVAVLQGPPRTEVRIQASFSNGRRTASVDRYGVCDVTQSVNYFEWEADAHTANRELRGQLQLFQYMEMTNTPPIKKADS
ncbi:hypothetical protein DAETH_10010 [Deinococcus aetherius]|uniref:Uncharacterized protein n=1 Tax=Deinococcus aetherius TaxID=200252 RepID=A0ABM8AB79_9DEIO|nr:hypothetical protein [Deinococcus aetherius]BDP41032.1 hypothetical protein DAETH_10010 [Deinococcus aetherius]